MIELLLAVAVLTWNLLPGAVFVGLPSEGVVEEVCVEETCVAPDNSVCVVVPWGPIAPAYVKARVLQGGDTAWIYAYPLPNYTG